MKNIGVFVDVQNIYYTCRDVHQRQFNYRALWQHLESKGNIIIANAYAIDRNDAKQKGFQKALVDIGFDIKLKPFIQRADGSAKGDWDVGITIDMIEAAPKLDEVILLSGDGDFDRLLKHLRTMFEIETEVISVKSLTAQSLVNASNHFINIPEKWLL